MYTHEHRNASKRVSRATRKINPRLQISCWHENGFCQEIVKCLVHMQKTFFQTWTIAFHIFILYPKLWSKQDIFNVTRGIISLKTRSHWKTKCSGCFKNRDWIESKLICNLIGRKVMYWKFVCRCFSFSTKSSLRSRFLGNVRGVIYVNSCRTWFNLVMRIYYVLTLSCK